MEGCCSLKRQWFLYVHIAQLIVAMIVSRMAFVREVVLGRPKAICELVIVFGRSGVMVCHMYCV